MSDFSTQEAAFSGFRIVRDHPRFLIVWAIFALVVSVVLTAAFIGLAGAELVRLQQSMADGYRNLPLLTSIVQKLLPAYAVVTTVGLSAYGVLFAAMNRAVLRPEDYRFAYFRHHG